MRKTVSFALIALVIIMTTFSSPAAAQDNQARPDLRGPEAVEKLKETGQYESLMEAVKAARKENGQPTGEPNDLAVGQTTKLTASDGAVNDFFGWSVAVSGDTAIVGAYADDVGANSNQGSAYVFTRSGTTWSQQAQLTAADGAPGDQFGYSVAISGDTVVVGASGDTVGANPAQGSAYVFTRSGAAWTQQQKLLAADGAAFDQFGGSVAISGDTVLIGASRDTIGASSNQGSAYIFVRSGAAWSQQAQLLASDGAANDQFGESVGISGDTAIVGAFAHTVGANAAQGSAYVFTRSGAAWTQQAQLTAADGAGNDQFGWSVAISGDTAVVGAYVGTVGANAVQGSAYVFVRSGAAWSQQQKLTAADGAAGDQFGWSVAISGNIIIVGARFDDVGFNNDQGSTYVFVRSGAVWSQQQKLTVADGAAGDQFGYGVAISGSNMIVGAYLNNVGANADQGSAYVYRVLGTTWTQEAQKVASDGAANDLFGRSVAISGDTAIVGAWVDDVGANIDQGSAYIFVRSGTAWTQQQQLLAADGAAGDQFGGSVAISGDTVVIGASSDTIGANNFQGSAYVFTRSGAVWTQQQKLTAAGGATDDFFGTSVAIDGNTAVIGAFGYDAGANSSQGSAYVFTRSGAVWTQQQQLTAADGAANDLFGSSVAISGDTVVIGAYAGDVGANADQGAAYVFTRNGAAWTPQAKLTASDGAANDLFGISAAINGDTVVIGAQSDDVGANADQGSAYIFVRSGVSWTPQAKLTASDGAAGDQFGGSAAIDGNTVVIGAYFDDVGANADQGSAYVFVRNEAAWTQQQKLTGAGGAADDRFGRSVAISGDKIIVGANFSDASVSIPFSPQAADQGAVFIFINAPLAPTAASVSIGGRVLTAEGAGLRNAVVYLTKANGETVSTRTTTFGYYRFDELTVGQTVVIEVNSKRYQFTPQVITVADNAADIDFIAGGENLK